MIIVATIPTGIIGILFNDAFSSMYLYDLDICKFCLFMLQKFEIFKKITSIIVLKSEDSKSTGN